MKGKIYLIPTTLGDSQIDVVIPGWVQQACKELTHFAVENLRTARRYLKKIDREIIIDDLSFFELNKHTKEVELERILSHILKGNNMGIMSEAGCPGIADPGSDLVRKAHEKGIQVIPMTGPSSILLALIASGMNGQNFAFSGYLPIKQPDRGKKIKELERKALNDGQTQLFMETPYRNQKLLDELLTSLGNDTKLCIAADITLQTEFIATKKVSDWKKKLPEINKRPAIFALGR